MISDAKLIIILLLAALVLLPTGGSIKVSVSSDAGSISEELQAGDEESVKGGTVISAGGLSHFIEGHGSLRESHSVSNTAGARAEVGVDIRNSGWYCYSYELWPGKGSFWPAHRFAQVAASEQLEVTNARYIQAYARAGNAKGYTADVSTVIYDPWNMASLSGYRNLAMASKGEAMASQTAQSASAPNGYIQMDSEADLTQVKSRPLQFREDEAQQSARIDQGSLQEYSDLASASAQGIIAEQQAEAATGEQIQTRSQSASWTASLFQGLKKTADASVKTTVEGALTGYSANASSSRDYAEAEQSGHVVGAFSSTAVAGKASKTRESNYGEEYDFGMQAKKDASGSYASGWVGYYVDNNSPVANRIQGAVDAAESGDAINVAAGTYRENVNIQKSLNVKGAGAGETVVDGGQADSVFTIGSQDNTDLEVALSGMRVQNGLAPDGGGIYSLGTLTVADCMILGNNAPGPTWPTWHGFGGGIYNYGTAVVTNCSITGNAALYGGGIFNTDTAIITVKDSEIYGNTGWVVGGGIENAGLATIRNSGISNNNAFYCGGIYNLGTLKVMDSLIDSNTASDNGGAIYNAKGITEISNSTISRNTANGWGGGIYNDYYGGVVNLNGCTLENNAANYGGGGIFNGATASLRDCQINSNEATNRGGGLFSWYNSKTEVTNCSISGNYANDGGGIWNQGILYLDSTFIDHNAGQQGGGIYNDYYGTVYLNSGSIDNNEASNGGGIYSAGTLSIGIDNASPSNGPSIFHNTASYGGGIYNDFTGIVNLNGGSIDHNYATAPSPSGGGIYNNLGTIKGNPDLVHDNTPDDISPVPIDWLPNT